MPNRNMDFQACLNDLIASATGGLVGGGGQRRNAVERAAAKLARRRLFLLVTIAVENAETDTTINNRIFRSELIRVVKSEGEMSRILNNMGSPFYSGCLEDRFFKAVHRDIKGFAKVVGALIPTQPTESYN